MRPTRALLLPLICLTTLAVAQPTATQGIANHTHHTTDSIVVCVPYSAGWNMASNPVLRAPGTDSIWQVFCSPSQWGCYQGGYVIPCGTTNGFGLWIKRQTPTVCCIAGGAIAQDSIPVATSWNLIGTISYPVAVSSIYSIPPNIIRSRFFGFSSSYVAVDTLRPGFGYWVKMMGPGQLVLQH